MIVQSGKSKPCFLNIITGLAVHATLPAAETSQDEYFNSTEFSQCQHFGTVTHIIVVIIEVTKQNWVKGCV